MGLFTLFYIFVLAISNFTGSLKNASQSSTESVVDGTFHVQYYHTQQPEKLLDGGEHERISFAYLYPVQGIAGEKLGVLWQGKIKQPETGMLTIQHRDSSKLHIEIDGKPIKLQYNGYTSVNLEKGHHDVQVRYEPKWYAGKMVVNFLRTHPRTPDEVANDIQAASKNAVIGFAQVRGKMDKSGGIHPKDWQWRNAELSVFDTNKPQIIVLSAQELVNVELKLHDNAKIKAIVALNNVGEISGSNVPVYRVAQQISDDWAPRNCNCIGGTHLSCDGDAEHGFPEIQTLSNILFGKKPDVYALESKWFTADLMDKSYRQTMKKYQEQQDKCGGSQAINFDNAIQPNPSNHQSSLNGFDDGQSWFSQMGG